MSHKHPTSPSPTRPRGERHGRAKLTAEAVREIRRARRAGDSLWALATRYGVSQSAISRAASGHTWSHLELEGVTDE